MIATLKCEGCRAEYEAVADYLDNDKSREMLSRMVTEAAENHIRNGCNGPLVGMIDGIPILTLKTKGSM